MQSPRGRRPLLLASAVVTALATHGPAAAQEEPAGPVLEVNAARIEIGGRIQTQFNTSSVGEVQPSEFLLRRIRLEATVRVNDLITGRVQPDFAGDRVSVKDAWVRLDFHPALQLLAGKAHKPFSVLEQTSANRILPIERGTAIRGLTDGFDEYALVNGLKYSDRDVGVQVLGRPAGAPLGFAYQAGAFAGPLNSRVGAQDSYQFAARASVTPARNVRLGTAWSSRDFARPAAADGDPQLARGHAFQVDAELGTFAPGFHFLGEAVHGDFDPFTGSEFTGAQGWFAYRTPRLGARVAHLEPIFRASWASIDDDTDGRARGGLLLTPGVNLYFTPLNRVMFNYDLWNPRDDGETARSFKAQMQFAF